MSSDLLQMPISSLIFHGSEARFDRVQPRPSTRIGPGGQVNWKGEAIFAAPDPRVALHYSGTLTPQVTRGIDLVNFTPSDKPVTYHLTGGKNKEDALNTLYGNPAQPETCKGYMYLLRDRNFAHEPGLGSMEKVSRDVNANLGRIEIDRRKAIDNLVESGDVILKWEPE